MPERPQNDPAEALRAALYGAALAAGEAVDAMVLEALELTDVDKHDRLEIYHNPETGEYWMASCLLPMPRTRRLLDAYEAEHGPITQAEVEEIEGDWWDYVPPVHQNVWLEQILFGLEAEGFAVELGQPIIVQLLPTDEWGGS